MERVNSHVHLPVPAACALYDAPEDGCILHPKHVEQGKCNKVTLNNLHQAGLNKPVYNDAWEKEKEKEKKLFRLLIFLNQPYMFRATNPPILRSTF